MSTYLELTDLLDFEDPGIRRLIDARCWAKSGEAERIRAVYDFVRDEVRFGYNEDDAIPASKVLRDGYGQCNTKGILFMALLRGLGVPCRFHGFAIDKALQKGALSGIWYLLAPKEIVHSWVEVSISGRWINIEGFILDMPYLRSVQRKFPEARGSFCGFGIATDCIEAPMVEWTGGDTYIQKEGIVRDFGVFDTPDAFFKEHAQNLGFLKKLVYKSITRHTMNARVFRIRDGMATK